MAEKQKTASTFSFRIFRLNIVLVFLVGVTLSFLFVREQLRQSEIALDRRAAVLARGLSAAAQNAFAGSQEPAVRREAIEPAMRVAMLDADVQYAVLYDDKGAAIGDATPDGSLEPPPGSALLPADVLARIESTMLPPGWDEAAMPPALSVARALRAPADGYPTAGMDYYYPIVTGDDDGDRELAGIARIGMTRGSLVAARERSIGLGVLILALSMIGATFASLELSRRLARPLKHLTESAKTLGAGKLEARAQLPMETRDEVGELAQAFNRMAANLQEVYTGLEQKVAERTAQLSEEKHRLEAVLDTVDEGVIMLDADGLFVMVNRKFLEMFELERKHVLGRRFPELLRDVAGRLGDPRAMIERTKFLAGHPRERAVDMFEVVQPDRKVIHRFSAPVWDYDRGDVQRGFLGRIEVYRDITRETEIDRMKSEFISTVSHELRTPLTSIKGSLGLILGGAAGPLPPELKELLEIGQNNSERLIRLINDILDISKIESGKMKLKLTDFDLAEVIRESALSLEGFARRAELKIETSFATTPLTVNADRDRILQVLVNLLSNAIKFSPKGSTITVAAARDPRGVYRVSVSDRGIGIPAEQMGRLFQKFQQIEGTFAAQVGGTGLGLAICKALVHEHGGEISADSRVGQGSTFTFSLPAPEATADATLPTVSAMVAGATARILVVDDDADVASLVRMYLEQEGYECTIASRGKQALEILQAAAGDPTKRFDAVTLDLRMPDLSGFDVAKAIKEDPALSTTPILFVTVEDADDAGAEASHLAFADWITKPIDPMRLISAVKLHVARRPGKPGVLVVDDDPDIQKLLDITLSREGFEVQSAASGEEALKRMIDRRPDLIVLDLVMPQLDGFALMKKLREDRRTRRIPVLILTAKDLTDAEREILQAGATKFLTKSYANREALLREVAELLNGALRGGEPMTTGEGMVPEWLKDRVTRTSNTRKVNPT